MSKESVRGLREFQLVKFFRLARWIYRIEVPTHHINAIFLNHVPRTYYVALGLRHLLSILIQNKSERDYCFVRRVPSKNVAIASNT